MNRNHYLFAPLFLQQPIHSKFFTRFISCFEIHTRKLKRNRLTSGELLGFRKSNQLGFRDASIRGRGGGVAGKVGWAWLDKREIKHLAGGGWPDRVCVLGVTYGGQTFNFRNRPSCHEIISCIVFVRIVRDW